MQNQVHSVRIVVIDDNRDIASSTKMLLAYLGHQVWTAHTGPAGVALVREVIPDLVLCDIGLPGMTGYEVAESLRHDPSLSSTRLCAVTAYRGDQAEEASRWAGFEKHLVKPVAPEELLAVVASCFTGRPAAPHATLDMAASASLCAGS